MPASTSPAAHSHTRIAGLIQIALFPIGDAGPVPLQQNNTAKLLCKNLCSFHSVFPDGAAQPGELSVVGCQNGGMLSSAQYIFMPGNHIYAVRIQNNRTLGIFQHCLHHFESSRRLSQAGTNQNSIHIVHPTQNLRNGFFAELSVLIRQRKHHRLIELHRLNGIDALRHTQEGQSGTAAR